MSQSGLTAQELVGAIEAFKREALLLAGLHHQSLPRIHDHFCEAGRWYLVMDYIEGETLETLMSGGAGDAQGMSSAAQTRTLPVDVVLDIGIHLCSVLDYLHTQHPPIIFRDLKPANIMRTADGRIYLIDFGIARHFKPGQM